MSRTLLRQLIGHEDFALGYGKVEQLRGSRVLEFRQIMLEFIFATVAEIKELDYTRYTHIGLHRTTPYGPVWQYYYDPLSFLVPDDIAVIRPDTIQPNQLGRWIKINSYADSGSFVFDTIIASCSDEDTPLTTGPKTTFRAPYPFNMANGYVRASLTTAPAGSSMIIDMTMNGVSIFSTPMHIDANEKTTVTAVTQSQLDIPNDYVPDDAEFVPSITQIGSSFAGAGLKVALTGVKVTN